MEEDNENIARDIAHFNKIKTNIKKNNKNKSKCIVFMTEEMYDKMVNKFIEILKDSQFTLGNNTGHGYLKISDNKYIKADFYMISFNPHLPIKSGIVCSTISEHIDPSNICFVENYNGYNNYFKNNRKYGDLQLVLNIKDYLNKTLENPFKSRNSVASIRLSLESLFYGFSLFIIQYEKILEIEILTYNKISNIKTNYLNKNNFYNTHSKEIIQLLQDFVETRIWNYVKFQYILTELSILIYKYDIITNSSITKILRNKNF